MAATRTDAAAVVSQQLAVSNKMTRQKYGAACRTRSNRDSVTSLRIATRCLGKRRFTSRISRSEMLSPPPSSLLVRYVTVLSILSSAFGTCSFTARPFKRSKLCFTADCSFDFLSAITSKSLSVRQRNRASVSRASAPTSCDDEVAPDHRSSANKTCAKL